MKRACSTRSRTTPASTHAEAMSVYRASFVPDDPLFQEKQWHLQRVGATSAWEYACGRDVTVAVIDTGVACWDQGPFSRGSDSAGTRCERGYDFVNDRAEAADDHGHGTHVAGTIAQTTNNGRGAAGLAFCARLMPIKVLTKQGWGTVANVAEGIRFAADEGASVINLSLGGPIKSRILEDAVNHALSRGVVVVAAAGNSGRSVGFPAAYEGVIAVSATDANDKIAWFSSRGPEVTIAAPGVAVTQQTVCDGGKNKCELFGTFSGTSMASPHVAGAAALLMSNGVTAPAAVRAALENAATPKDDANLYGAGVLDAGRAVRGEFVRRLGLRFGWLVALAVWISASHSKVVEVARRSLPSPSAVRSSPPRASSRSLRWSASSPAPVRSARTSSSSRAPSASGTSPSVPPSTAGSRSPARFPPSVSSPSSSASPGSVRSSAGSLSARRPSQRSSPGRATRRSPSGSGRCARISSPASPYAPGSRVSGSTPSVPDRSRSRARAARKDRVH